MSYFKHISCYFFSIVFEVVTVMGFSETFAAKKQVIRFSTLAPEGSFWIKSIPQPDQKSLKKFQQAGVKARKSSSGKMFPPEFLSKVLVYLAEIQ